MGASTVLIERGKMGGDCLNYGCVPSKALLAAGHAAQAFRDAGKFGVESTQPSVSFPKVRDHVRGVIDAIAPLDSVERFEGLGVRVIKAGASFRGAREIDAGDVVIKARRIVVATGSSPFVPPIEGLDTVPYFTNETIFENDTKPDHLIVIGGGPIGLELAQAHRRLGADVTVIEMLKAFGQDDPEISEVALERIRDEGVRIEEQAQVVRVEKSASGVTVTAKRGDDELKIEGTHLLVAVGRKANLDGLNLETAGIEYSRKGIVVDSGLRTTNSKVFAIGDVAGPYLFTHMAGYHAGIVIRRALFRLPARVDYRAVPWVTYTDPEVAHVGLKEGEARKKHRDIRVLRWPYEENDRAQAERRTEGLAKVIVTEKGHVVGASIVGAHAGEIIQPWALMIAKKMKIGAMASVILPYPTLGEVNKRAAGGFYTDKLFSDRTRRIVKFLLRFG